MVRTVAGTGWSGRRLLMSAPTPAMNMPTPATPSEMRTRVPPLMELSSRMSAGSRAVGLEAHVGVGTSGLILDEGCDAYPPILFQPGDVPGPGHDEPVTTPP